MGDVDNREIFAEYEEISQQVKQMESDIKTAKAYLGELRHKIKDNMLGDGVKAEYIGSYVVSVVDMPKKLIIDSKALPFLYCKREVIIKPDEDVIWEAINSGEEVPGVIVESGKTTLRIAARK